MPTDFACHCDHLSGSRALVTVAGELDLHSCSAFKRAIDAAARRAPVHLVLDLSAVTFMDSTALGGSWPPSSAAGRSRCTWSCAKRSCCASSACTGYDQVFVIHASVEDALLDTGRRQAQSERPS